MILLVDYGAGNLASIANMLQKAGFEATISSRSEDVLRAEKVILPGVGHFDEGMRQLDARGLVEPLRKKVMEERAPLLGICLGAQLLARHSDEGERPGLGWLAADVRPFDQGRLAGHLKVPHMGWADVDAAGADALFREMPGPPRFYFVHSYHLVCDDEREVAAWAHHGYRFAAAVRRANVTGVQFHPEKSHAFGLALLRNFARGE
jgi:imidazole glycerol-phosphate synthase subunit HisH